MTNIERIRNFKGIPSEIILLTKEVGNTAEESVAVKETIRADKRIIPSTTAFHV